VTNVERDTARYDAFISYSHAADGRLAPAVQRALHRIARPWYRRRALRVFRDKTSLAVTPAVWPTIETALKESRYLVVLASPDAARSEWVEMEITWWLNNRSTDTLLIVLTAGNIRWNTSGRDFYPEFSDALPSCLLGRFPQEPLWVDLRFTNDQDRLSLRHGAFRDAVVTLAAKLHGKPKDELEGEDVRQHRRTMRLAGTAMITVLTLAATTTTFYVQRDIQRARADAEHIVSDARALASRAAVLQRSDPGLARQLTAAAHGMAPQDPEVTNAVLAAASIPKVASIGSRPVHPRAIFVNNGQALAVGSDRDVNGDGKDTADGAVEFLDPVTMNQIGEAKDAPTADNRRVKLAEVTDLATNPSGTALAVASGLGLSLWDVADPRAPKSLWIPEVPPTVEPRWGRVAFSSKGSLLAYGKDNTIRLYDVTDPRSPKSLGELPAKQEFAQFAFSPDGRAIAVHDNEIGTVTLWDVTVPGQPVKGAVLPNAEKDQLNSRPPPALAFASTGTLAYAGTNNTIRIYQVSDPGNPVEQAAIEGHTQPVIALAFTPDGRTLASGSSDTTVHITDVSTPNSPVPLGTLEEHTADVTSVSFRPDGAELVTASQDVTARLWPFVDPRRRSALTSITGPVASGTLAATPDRTVTVTGGGSDHDVTLWDTTDPTKPTRLGSAGVGGKAADAAITPDRRTLVVIRSGLDDPVRLLAIADPRNPLPVGKISGFPTSLSAVAVSGDSRLLAVGSRIGQIKIYDITNPATPRPLSTIDRGGPNEHDRSSWVTGLAFDPIKPLLVGTSLPRRTSVWDLTDATNPGLIAQVEEHKDQVQGAVFSPNGQWLATTDRVGTVLLWPMTDLAAIRANFTYTATLGIPSSGIPVVNFSPDSRRLVAALDKNIYV